MLIRNRRKLISVALTFLTFCVVYILFNDVELAFVSKGVIRKKELDNNLVSQIASVNVDDTRDALVEKVAPPAESQKNGKIDETLRVPGAIMPSMPDQDAKKELGNASWKYFHTLLARFPDEPSVIEREKLKNFIQLYAELYPCGECSYHFVKMIKKFPVQTSSRKAAALWGCDIHNKVNAYLKKDIYDCTNILEDYDCGCGDGPIGENQLL
ncbi:similar to Saccharomyces cerevisiae YPR037C ERV2 Flavin-linked sulfhydryl oxidase localized to the endoplasmic reticulum lumen, involved in disulfide bond formation within the ER [Maudiozyma saulgeensis]|uniref:Sulfhydryl oxidase n=1 Tax=Maudiozyma saulgeensis TaxID=1789683 RepID=A0A1X7R390_9SACH|nr:similar to Saccharomyces cerevisiae YPR037C ERV2 Flavin-linked sulfhydryl oxidase localized to the endoplasmic reticulum lumen, involved in disulfide bond formation within the ER [Kazachstania saulgeensis]